MGGSNTKVKKQFPHPLWVITLVVLAAVVLTWLIPSGEFVREVNEAGLKVVVPDQFSFLEKIYLKPWNVPSYIVQGFLAVASMLFMTIFSGCAFTVVLEGGALQSLIAGFVKKFGSKDIIFISLLIRIDCNFSVCGYFYWIYSYYCYDGHFHGV